MNNYNFKIFELIQTKEHLIKAVNYDKYIYHLFSVKLYKPTFLKVEYILNNLHKTIMPFSKSNINKLYKHLKSLENNEHKEEKDEEKEETFIHTLQDEIIFNVSFNKELDNFGDYIYNITNIKNYIINEENNKFKTIHTEYNIVKNILNHSTNIKIFKIKYTYISKDGTILEHVRRVKDVDFVFNSKQKRDEIYLKILYETTTGSEGESWCKKFLMMHPDSSVNIKISAFNLISTEGNQYRYIQNYKDSSSGVCVYDGLIKFFEIYKTGEGRSIYNKLTKNEEIFKKSYNIKELEEMARLLRISITIKDLINNENNLKININDKNYYKIKFINTKLDHLDLYTCENIKPLEITLKEYNEIKIKTPFYIEKCGVLHTLKESIKQIKTPFQMLFNSWKEQFNINSFSIEINSDASKFINNYDDKIHRFFNKNIINDNSLYNEMDLSKAFYNYKGNRQSARISTGAYISVSLNNKNEYLNINEFQKQINNNMIGFYEVEILEYNEKLTYLGFTKGSCHVLFSAQLEIIIKLVKLNIKNYTISPSIDAPFNELFLKYGDNLSDDKDDGCSAYGKAIGCLMIENDTTTTTIKTIDDTFNKILLLNKNQSLHQTDEKNIYKVLEINENPKSNRHVAMCIHGYSSAIILETILNNFETISDVVAVKVDAIVYKKDSILIKNDLNKLFKEVSQAKIKTMIDRDLAVYGPYFEPYKKENMINFHKSFIMDHVVNSVIIIQGKGGSGKTTACLSPSSNFNNNNVVFTSFCWNLIQQKQQEYPQILGLSTCKLIGSNGAQKYNIDNKKIIIADEITLNNKNDLLKMVSDNETKIIILLGDIDDKMHYQCSIFDNVIKTKEIKNIQISTFTKNYRFNEELNNKLEILRELMRQKTTTQNIFNFIKKEFKNNFIKKEDVIFDKKYYLGVSALKPEFKNNICTLSKQYLKSDNINDYNIFVKQTNIYKNELRGAQHEFREDSQYKNFEASIFRTIHSFQGQEVKKDTETKKYKIVININSLFNYQLIYTALSRATTCDQIIIVDDLKERQIKKSKYPEIELLKQKNIEEYKKIQQEEDEDNEANGLTEEDIINIKNAKKILEASIQEEKINKIKEYIIYTKNNIKKEEEEDKKKGIIKETTNERTKQEEKIIKLRHYIATTKNDILKKEEPKREQKKEFIMDYDGLDYGL